MSPRVEHAISEIRRRAVTIGEADYQPTDTNLLADEIADALIDLADALEALATASTKS
jgi:hypothetical protein